MYRRYAGIIGPIAILIIALGVWEGGVRLFDFPAYILPPPSRIALAFITRFPLLASHASATIVEVVVGMLLGTVGGGVLGVLIFNSPVVERAVYPLIIGSQMVPVFAIAPLLVVWLGYGLWPKVVVAALISFFPMTISTRDGLGAATRDQIDLLRTLGASDWQIFRLLRLPAAAPALLSGAKIAVTMSVVGATIGEWVGARSGLGYLMLQSNAMLRVDVVFAAIVMLTLIGLLLFMGLRIIERRVLRWRLPDELWEGGSDA